MGLQKYVEETGILPDIRTFSGVDKPLFEHFSAYCASMFVLSLQKRIQMQENETYLLCINKQILITPKKIGVDETPRPGENMLLRFFPLYAFTFKEQVYVLSNLEIVERTNLLQLEYLCEVGWKKSGWLTLAARIEYPYEKLEEESGGITLTFVKSELYKLSLFSFDQIDIESSDNYVEEVMFNFFPGGHKIPHISKTIILNQNTCRNLYQKSRKQRQNKLLRGIQSCLPIKIFFSKMKQHYLDL